MDANMQVILVLKLALYIIPPALYFLTLGLVNSQSRPHLISSRSDWLALIVVFCPILLYPSIWLASAGYFFAGLIAVALAGLGVYLSLPRPQSGWVVYNCSEAILQRSLLSALERARVEYQIVTPRLIRLPNDDVSLKLSSLPLLKNITIAIDSPGSNPGSIARIEKHLNDQLDRTENEINISGPTMLIAGTGILIVPLMMMVRHIDSFVRVVTDLWPV